MPYMNSRDRTTRPAEQGPTMSRLSALRDTLPAAGSGVRILSCGVILLHRPERKSWRYLLLRAFNYWDFPKGMCEPGETPLAAAIREVREETTITELDFRWGEVFRETPPYNHGAKVARYYIACTGCTHVELPVSPELGRPEHSEYRWVRRDEAWELLTPRVRAVLRWSDNILRGPHGPR